jgi:hypothetical protein
MQSEYNTQMTSYEEIVSHSPMANFSLGEKQTEDIWDQGADENTWTEEGWNNERLENTA